jgi:hypothetical protein
MVLLFPHLRRTFGPLVLSLLVTTAASGISAGVLPVFPGAAGYGTDTPAGRGGTVYRVTNLEDDGPGSLRHGVERVSGPRVIVFEVSGVIRLKSDLAIHSRAAGESGFLSIAGQTAPAPGITLANGGISIQASHVLIQHLAIRTGDRLRPVDNRDCIKIGAAPGQRTHHVVIDHVSCSWAVDETVSTWSEQGEVCDVTLSNSIISHPVINGGHSKGSHPYGVLGGRNTHQFTIVGNIMAFNLGRNPLIRDRTSGAQIVNNLIYHPGVWSNSAIYIGHLPLPPHAVSVVGNVVLRRPIPFTLEQTGTDGVRRPVLYQASDYRSTAVFVHDEVEPGVGLYLHDNRVLHPQSREWQPVDGDPYHREIFKDGKLHPTIRLERDPYANSGGRSWSPWPAEEVEGRVLQAAGQRPAQRDAIDARLIAQIRARSGDFLQDLGDLGEDPWAPVDVQRRRPLVLPSNPSVDDDADGYTNLEEWLHQLAAEVEGRTI